MNNYKLLQIFLKCKKERPGVLILLKNELIQRKREKIGWKLEKISILDFFIFTDDINLAIKSHY
jgi:hypothetical protein